MIFKQITTTKDPLFNKAWEIYCSNFPLDERRDLLEQKKTFEEHCNSKNSNENIFHFTVLLKKSDNTAFIVDGIPCTVVGILAYWNFSEVFFGEHLAINQAVQGMGIGKIAIDYLKRIAHESSNNGSPKPIVLEIELPIDFITKRRESFYKKLDFKENPHEHFQPCYHKGDEPIEMIIMSWPNEITPESYETFKQEQLAIMPELR